MRKSLGSKRREMSGDDIDMVTRLFGGFVEAELVTVLDAQGQEVGRWVVPAGTGMPDVPVGGTLRSVPISRIFRNEDFGYTAITVERPLRDEQGNVVLGVKGKHKGKVLADSALRDTENVPLSEDVDAYFQREVLPYAPDAWIDGDKSRVGYEIAFNRYFYRFEAPRELGVIDGELRAVAENMMAMLEGLA
jgi:type I restriction enzyme M protein